MSIHAIIYVYCLYMSIYVYPCNYTCLLSMYICLLLSIHLSCVVISIIFAHIKAYKDKCRNKGSWLGRDTGTKWRHRRLLWAQILIFVWADKRRSVCSNVTVQKSLIITLECITLAHIILLIEWVLAVTSEVGNKFTQRQYIYICIKISVYVHVLLYCICMFVCVAWL